MDRELRRQRRMAMRGVPERLGLSFSQGGIEMRAKPNGTPAGTAFEFNGYASVYGVQFDMWDPHGEPYKESVAYGVSKRSLNNPNLDVPFLIGHNDAGIPLARTKSGTMTLSEDTTGTHVHVPSMDGRREEVRALASAVERGDMDEMSLAFVCLRQEWDEDFEHRTIVEWDLHRGDVCAVVHGANPATAGAWMSPVEQLSYRRPVAIGGPVLLEYRAGMSPAAMAKAEAHGHPGVPCADPDGDGDCDLTPEGDTDHDYWSADGRQIKALPGADEDRAAARLYELLSVTQAERDKAKAAGNSLPDGCVAGETLVATRQGPRRIDTLVGECDLLTDKGWERGEVRSFGVKPLLAVTLRKGPELATVYATAGHRWLTADNDWKLTGALVVGDRIPHVEVSEESVSADRLKRADHAIAADAEQSAHGSGFVGVVDVQAGPRATRARIGAQRLRDLPADGALAVLQSREVLELSLGDAVLVAQSAIAADHPALICDVDKLGADTGALHHAKAAVGTPALTPDVEVRVRAGGVAGAARDRSLVLDRHSLRIPADARPGFGLSELQPAGVAGEAQVTRKRLLRWLAAIGTRFVIGHGSNPIQSATWEVTEVRETSRREEVFCAVVPDLHRFTLANGILTGNSYPINNIAQLHSAAVLAASHHGDWKAAQALIRRRAKELGVDVTTLPGFGEEKAAGMPLEVRASAIEDMDLASSPDYDAAAAVHASPLTHAHVGDDGVLVHNHAGDDGHAHDGFGQSANVLVDDATGIPGEETQFAAPDWVRERRLMELELEELAAR